MKKVLVMLLIFLSSTFVLSRFYYVDFEHQEYCVIRVVPSFLLSNLDLRGALRLIKYASPEDYAEVCSRVRVINKNPGCGGLDGGCFYENKPDVIYIGNDQGNIAFAADLILHETCHARQYNEGRPLLEQECYKVGKLFLDKVTVY